jgi:hypothetical protein
LEKQLKVFKNSDNNLGAVYTGAIFIDEESGRKRIKRLRAKGWILTEELAYNPVGSTSRVMVKRECFGKCGDFDEDLPCHEDWEMWIRLAERYKFDYVNEPLIRYFERSDSLSAQPSRLVAGYKALWAKYDVESRERWLKALHYFRLGHRLCYYGATCLGRLYLLKAVMTEPWQLKYGTSLLLSLLGPKLYRTITFAIMSIFG